MMSYDKYFPSEYAISSLTYILIALLKNYIRASFENFNPNFNFSHLGIFSLKPLAAHILKLKSKSLGQVTIHHYSQMESDWLFQKEFGQQIQQ